MARELPHVFSIPAGLPFLPTLTDALLSGRFGGLGDDPLALADVVIFLPTRRAARALHEAILERSAGRTAILPEIRPIGDVDEADLLLQPFETPADRLVLPAAFTPLDRQLTLARLTAAWSGALRRDLLGLSGPGTPLIPASAADAFHLAGDLARLIDDVETAGVDWRRLDNLVPENLARYWQISLDFLKIVAEAWPAILAEKGRADPSARRDRLIRAEAARLKATAGNRIVLAAGSTGSIPATAHLLATIARLPRGAVILPDLDQQLDEIGWNAIGGPDLAESAPAHPQYGLRQLLAAIGIARREVEALGAPVQAVTARRRLISEVFRPAATTEAWASSGAADPEATKGMALLVARTEQEEAVAIALALRETVETPGATAALVTPDRRIAGRVAIELARFGIAVDDSAGRPLSTAPPGVLARLVLAAAASDGAPLDLLALAKHPLAHFGMERARCRRAAEILDLHLFRGRPLPGGLARLEAEFAALDLPEEFHEPAGELITRLVAALMPLKASLLQRDRLSVSALTAALLGALKEVSADEAATESVWTGPAGGALEALLEGLTSEAAGELLLRGFEYLPLVDAAMAAVAVAGPPIADGRVFIWGTLEARLQSVDRIVLAGLDEGIWPSEARTDPWLSRSMRLAFGLEAPERRLGLSAHDFASALATPDVVVTRAERRGGTPTVPARWLQRLAARLGPEPSAALTRRGHVYVEWARALDTAEMVRSIRRPEPRPPLAARPRQLSVTEIETLVRDPYAIYARRVLKLQPLDPLDVVPDAAMRGTLIHEALGEFGKSWSGPYDERALAALIEQGRLAFVPIEPYPAIHALWWPRFLAIADWFIAWEAERGEIAARHAEIGGAWTLPDGFRLVGRADRIDLRRDGAVEILDFKTGNPPSAKQLSTGLAPQLALEVAMARAGGFPNIPAGASVATLGWIGLGSVGKGEPFRSAVRDRSPDELGAEAAERLAALITAYADPARAYVSRARPMFETRFESPYDHLARVSEWALGEDGEGEA
ncbi:double-strand break repair protein AddB [Kaistia algarum]|uniref:double-strand break repair protein AddB n=1 Tax=Kaistia algarum TaxID=2083279 RepID=UPI000CE8D733|nr:double-strand break repair protein AddB [Kaistia algarum]MCX5513686.1 double-strand break repair protein AddB [Kaistia algarum]PPE79438.1 double-strand break repair protein AddB [Kaistia algarum]